MPRSRLNKLATKKELLALIHRLIDILDTPISIQDVNGWQLWADRVQEGVRYPIEQNGQVLGWVTGDRQAAAIVAALLSYLAERELEMKDLIREVLKRYRETSLLYKLPEKLGSTLEIEAVARLIMNEASRLITASSGAMLRLDERTGMLAPIATFGPDYDRTTRIRLGEGLVGSLILAERAQILNQVRYDPATGNAGPKTYSVICAPLRKKDGLTGAMILSSREPVEYTAADLKLFNLLASQAAPAIERAAMYERLEEMVALRTEELTRLREDMTQTLIHDLRSPLNNIINSLYVMEEKPHQNPKEQRLALQIANNSAKRMLKLVNNILDVNRLEGKQAPLLHVEIDLARLIAAVLQEYSLLASKKSIVLKSDIPADLPSGWGDAHLIERVLQNLIDNALKFTPIHGRICVQARLGQPAGPGRPCGQTVLPAQLQVSVSDNGPGIPPELHHCLFEKFVTGAQSERGTGLGLAFCRRAIKAHGGLLTVDSKPMQGTTFTFTLPTAPK